MEKEINGHLYITNDNLKRIADAIEEILRLVKKDMEPRTKKKIREESDEEIEEEARLKDGDDELSWSK